MPLLASYSFEVKAADLDGLLDAAFARAYGLFGGHARIAIEDFSQFDVRDFLLGADGAVVGYVASCCVAQPARSPEPALHFAEAS